MQKMNEANLLKIHKKAAICRAFEEEVFDLVQKKIIKIPVYVVRRSRIYFCSQLQFFLMNGITYYKNKHSYNTDHSVYLNFGGDIDKLIRTFR